MILIMWLMTICPYSYSMLRRKKQVRVNIKKEELITKEKDLLKHTRISLNKCQLLTRLIVDLKSNLLKNKLKKEKQQ